MIENVNFIDGMDLTHYVPIYKCIYKKRNTNEFFTEYRLITADAKYIFVIPLYYALYNAMIYLGFNPNEYIPIIRTYTTSLKKDGTIRFSMGTSFRFPMKRLCVIEKGSDSKHAFNPDYKSYVVYANFRQDHIDNAFNVVFRFARRKVYIKTYDIEITMPPEEYIRQFLIRIKYPYFIYAVTHAKGKLSKVYREYMDVKNNTGRFKKYDFKWF